MCDTYTKEYFADLLKDNGIDDKNAELLSRKRYYIYKIALDTITNDVEPSDDLVKKS